MKKIFFMLAVLTGMFILTGCSDSPKAVAVKYFKALEAGDFETARQYSVAPIDPNAETKFKELPEEDKAKIKAEMKKVVDKLENDFEKEEIDGDTAKIYVKGDKNPLPLKKVDGKWKMDKF